MNNQFKAKSKTPLQFKVFHTLLGFAVFFSLITVPAEAQVITFFGIPLSSELLWWPIVFFSFQLIHSIYGFSYLRHALYLVILFHAIYILFLKFAIWLPASSFWQMQETYTQVLGRDFLYISLSSLCLWACILLPLKFINDTKENQRRLLFFAGLMLFSLLDRALLNPHSSSREAQFIIPILIYYFLNIFSGALFQFISRVEGITRQKDLALDLFKFQIPDITNAIDQKFKYHHILFCSSIVFFIASKTMAAKFISIGFLTINVGGIVFSLAYLTADMMTDVYGIERTKQMVLFTIFCNLLLVGDVWITNLLAIGENDPFKSILHNQARMFIASATAFS